MSDYYCIAGTRHRVPVCLEDEGVLQRKRHVIIDMTLIEIYVQSLDHFGYLNWWPAETAFEVMIGAILTQNTSWVNVEKAIKILNDKGFIAVDKIIELPLSQLGLYIRSTGYYNQKAKRLKELASWFRESYAGDIANASDISTRDLRVELLTLNGVGPETADSILLYSFDRLVFVVDAYTNRILSRMGIIKAKCSYDSLQELFMKNIPKDLKIYQDFHAQIVMLCKEYCRKTPKCTLCIFTSTCPKIVQ